jgi:hypothetical protein
MTAKTLKQSIFSLYSFSNTGMLKQDKFYRAAAAGSWQPQQITGWSLASHAPTGSKDGGAQ